MKNKNMNKSTFIEEPNEIFKEFLSIIKQEICTMSSHSLKKYIQVKEIYVRQNSSKRSNLRSQI